MVVPCATAEFSAIGSSILLRQTVERALMEDLGRGDLTTECIVPPDLHASGILLAKQSGRLAGLDVARLCFRMLDPDAQVISDLHDGEDIQKGQVIARLSGKAHALLGAERVALNLLQRMCGIATATAQVVALVADLGTKVTDTRKTAPGLRVLDKYSVRMGGGVNHRFGLDDGVLIKENHIRVAGGITAALLAVRRKAGHMVKVEIEVTNLAELDEALRAAADAVLLDNMSISDIREAVQFTRRRAILEASGNINLHNCRDVASTGVDLMSMGSLTHSVTALDLSIQLEMVR